MSKWKDRGTATIVLPPDDMLPPAERKGEERSTSSWEAVRSYVPERAEGARKEMHDKRMRRLARKRDKCEMCGALTGERCYDLFARPTIAYIRGFHAKRKLLPAGPATVQPMTRLPKPGAECACGGTAADHKLRTGWCQHCKGKCRRFR